MLEFLVAGLCIGDFACSDALQAYYKHNKQLQRYVRKNRKKIEQEIGKEVWVSATTLMAAAADQKVKLKLGHGFIFNGNSKEFVILYKKDF